MDGSADTQHLISRPQQAGLNAHVETRMCLEACDPGGSRTHNRLLRRQMLYPVELQGLLGGRLILNDRAPLQN